MSIFGRFLDWLASGEVPDCPSCRGTGEDCDNLGDHVYWKGRVYRVCFQCKGAGKV